MILRFWQLSVFSLVTFFIATGLYVDAAVYKPHFHLMEACSTCSVVYHHYDLSTSVAYNKLQHIIRYLNGVKLVTGVS